ncbi:hypothetical protein ACFX13_000857 [Malus domestica]
MALELSRICGFPLTNDLGKYLGVPLIHSRITKNTNKGLVEKAQAWLFVWKVNSLSLAGRVTLVQSVTSVIPFYAMQTIKLPVTICDQLDRLNKNFVYGSTQSKNKVNLVKWSQVCLPKSLGGLGLKNMRVMNLAILSKNSWRLMQGIMAFGQKFYKERTKLLHEGLHYGEMEMEIR